MNFLGLRTVSKLMGWVFMPKEYMKWVIFKHICAVTKGEPHDYKVKVKVKFFILPQTLKCTRGSKHETLYNY